MWDEGLPVKPIFQLMRVGVDESRMLTFFD